MTTETSYSATHPVDERYPTRRRELDEIEAVLADGRLSGGALILPVFEQVLGGLVRG